MTLPGRWAQRTMPPSALHLRRDIGQVWVKGVLLAFVMLMWGMSAYALHLYRGGKFHAVTEGLAYRSAQLNAEDLESRIQQHGIRTIINLREWEPSMRGYRAEKAVASMHEVEHHDFVLSEYGELPPQILDQLGALLGRSPKPVLIHWAGGAARIGLVSALFRYRLERVTVEACAGEASARYGHVPLLRPGVKAMEK